MRVQTILCSLKIALVFISSIFFYLLMIWGLAAIMPASSNDSNRHVELLIGWLVMLVSSWCFIKLKGMVEEIYKTMLSSILSVLSSLFFIVGTILFKSFIFSSFSFSFSSFILILFCLILFLFLFIITLTISLPSSSISFSLYIIFSCNFDIFRTCSSCFRPRNRYRR